MNRFHFVFLFHSNKYQMGQKVGDNPVLSSTMPKGQVGLDYKFRGEQPISIAGDPCDVLGVWATHVLTAMSGRRAET